MLVRLVDERLVQLEPNHHMLKEALSKLRRYRESDRQQKAQNLSSSYSKKQNGHGNRNSYAWPVFKVYALHRRILITHDDPLTSPRHLAIFSSALPSQHSPSTSAAFQLGCWAKEFFQGSEFDRVHKRIGRRECSLVGALIEKESPSFGC